MKVEHDRRPSEIPLRTGVLSVEYKVESKNLKISNSLTPVVLIPWLLIDVKSEGHVAFASKNVSSSKGLGIATGVQDEILIDLSSRGP